MVKLGIFGIFGNLNKGDNGEEYEESREREREREGEREKGESERVCECVRVSV